MSQPSTSGSSPSFFLELPKFDGPLVAGIAAGGDPALPDSDKLPVHGETTKEVYNNAIAWALTKSFDDDRTKLLFVSGVAVIVGCGMLRTRNGIPDGDWYESNSSYEISEQSAKEFCKEINNETMTTVNKIICATKLNFWTMNSHVGQRASRNTAAGYVQEVLLSKFDNPLPPNIVRVADMLGKYASTRFILTKAGIPNILGTESRVGSDVCEIMFDNNLELKFRALPAGTDRFAACYEAAGKLSKCHLSHFCPDISDFIVLPQWKTTIMENPAIYHVRALYLTGTKDNAFADILFENFVGRLGTFVRILTPPTSTLYCSPHFEVTKVKSAPDYDLTWEKILTQSQQPREAKKVSSCQLKM
jgi:hypothetical protein